MSRIIYVELREIFRARRYTQSIREDVYLKGTRVRNCVEKDVVITVDKCRKERRNRNSRRLMTPSISFYISCDVTKHQPSFPFWTLDAYSRVKSVHLERHPLPPRPYLRPLLSHAFRHVHCAWPCCEHVLRTYAGRQPISNERIGHGTQEGSQGTKS